MVYSPDSKTIASGSVYTIKLWDAATGNCIATLEKLKRVVKVGRPVRFSPDGKTLVAECSDGTFRFRNVARGKIIASLPVEGRLLEFSPDGTTLATAGKDGRIRLWDMPGGGAGK